MGDGRWVMEWWPLGCSTLYSVLVDGASCGVWEVPPDLDYHELLPGLARRRDGRARASPPRHVTLSASKIGDVSILWHKWLGAHPPQHTACLELPRTATTFPPGAQTQTPRTQAKGRREREGKKKKT